MMAKKKKRKPLTQKNYRDNKGERCPNCRKFRPTMVVLKPPQTVVAPTLGHALGYARVLCAACGATWLVEFRPYKYSGLRPEQPRQLKPDRVEEDEIAH
jgi:hypothetical protein